MYIMINIHACVELDGMGEKVFQVDKPMASLVKTKI